MSAATPVTRDDHQRGGDRAAERRAEPERQHRHDHNEPAADAEEAGERADGRGRRRLRARSGGCGHGPSSPLSPARCQVSTAASSMTGTNARISASALTERLPACRTGSRGPPATRTGARAASRRGRGVRATRPDRRGDGHDDERGGRRRPDGLVEHVESTGRARIAPPPPTAPTMTPIPARARSRARSRGCLLLRVQDRCRHCRCGPRSTDASCARPGTAARGGPRSGARVIAVRARRAELPRRGRPGWLGTAGTLLLVVYMLGIAALVARIARGHGAPTLLWVVATAGLWAACGGQALLRTCAGHRRRVGRRLGAAAGDRHRRRRAARAGAAGRPGARSCMAAGRPTAHRAARIGAVRRHRSVFGRSGRSSPRLRATVLHP